MKIAVILSTYNAPERLRPTLLGYAAQAHHDFELVVADDGSAQATRDVIREVSQQHDLAIRHVWQPDLGFRKCRILNQAALATQADYLIFSDGDCIPRKDFVACHAHLARQGHFLSGGYFKLPAAVTAQVTPQSVLTGQVTDARWLVSHGMQRTSKLSKLTASGWRARLFNALTPTRPTWNGHNASCWREDLLRVNGFDERMGYWAQDREFGERLVHADIKGVQVRYSAICVHLHHERPYKTEASRAVNRRIRAETRANRARWSAHGIVKGAQPLEQPNPMMDADIVIDGHRG